MSDYSDEELSDNSLLRFVVVFFAIIAIAVGFFGFGESVALRRQVASLERIIEQHGIAVQDAEVRK